MNLTRAGPVRGLSLIELLVVIAILAVASGMVVSMTDRMDDRVRFEETARRLAEVRSAILGPDAVSATGDLFAGDLAVRTAGADGRKDGDAGASGVFQGDYPPVEQPLVPQSDWVTDLRGLQVEVTNLTAIDFSASPVQARFRIIVPRWDRPSDPLGSWAEPDSDEWVGRLFSLDLAAVGSETGQNQRVLDFAATGRSVRVPHGRRMLFLVRDADGRPLPGVRAYAELLVSRRLSPPSYVKLLIRS